MGLVSTLLGVLGFGIGTSIGLLVGYFFYIYFQPSDVKDPIVRSLHELDSKALHSLIPEIPYWMKNPDYERNDPREFNHPKSLWELKLNLRFKDKVDWLNKFILDMWPCLDKAICNTIHSTTKPIFDQYIGKYWIESIVFDQLTLGSLPPTIHGVKVYETQEKELVVEPAMRWAGNTNVVLMLKLSFFKVTIQLLDLQISLVPRVTLKPLVPSFPCFANLSVSLMEKPNVDFGLKIFGGDIMAIPGLYRFIQDTIATQVSNIYHWPNHIEIPILEGSSIAVKKPVGILNVNVVRAYNLLKMDILGKSDPYVKLSLSGEGRPLKKTSIKMRNLNPEWNEQFKLIVKDPETQVLQLHVYDWDKVKMHHDKLGMQFIPLNMLVPRETKEFTLDLQKNMNPNDPQNQRNRGKIVVQLTFDPFKEDTGSFNKVLDEKLSGIDRGIQDVSDNGGLLLVTIEAAEDIEGKHHTNPYAVVLFRGEKKKTKVIRRSRDPRWNEDFQFMLEEAPKDEKLHIQVRSKGRFFSFHSKESLGYVDINISDVLNNGRINQSYHLINSRSGVIHIEMKWNTI